MSTVKTTFVHHPSVKGVLCAFEGGRFVGYVNRNLGPGLRISVNNSAPEGTEVTLQNVQDVEGTFIACHVNGLVRPKPGHARHTVQYFKNGGFCYPRMRLESVL